MGRKDLLDSSIVKGIGLLLAGGTVSFGLSVSLMLHIWDQGQAAAEETRSEVDRHRAKISEIQTSQAVIVEKLTSIESKLADFRADFKREVERSGK